MSFKKKKKDFHWTVTLWYTVSISAHLSLTPSISPSLSFSLPIPPLFQTSGEITAKPAGVSECYEQTWRSLCLRWWAVGLEGNVYTCALNTQAHTDPGTHTNAWTHIKLLLWFLCHIACLRFLPFLPPPSGEVHICSQGNDCSYLLLLCCKEHFTQGTFWKWYIHVQYQSKV